MELLKKYPKTFQWLFLLVVFFALCFAIEVPETYKFIRGQAEFVKDPNQSSYIFLGKEKFTKTSCDLPAVDYSFEELKEACRNFGGGIDIQIKDKSFINNQSLRFCESSSVCLDSVVPAVLYSVVKRGCSKRQKNTSV